MKFKIVALLILLVFCTLCITRSEATVRRLTNVYRYTGLSTDTKPTESVLAGSTFLETDTGRSFIYDSSSWTSANENFVDAIPDTLTAPGSGTAFYTKGYSIGAFQYTISSMNTTVVCAMQVKFGSSEWVGIGANTTQTTDGTYGFVSNEIASYDSTRFTFVSESGGTDAVVAINSSFAKE